MPNEKEKFIKLFEEWLNKDDNYTRFNDLSQNIKKKISEVRKEMSS